MIYGRGKGWSGSWSWRERWEHSQFLFSECERNEENDFQVNAVSNATHLLVSKGNQGGQLEVQV